jgi:hypothetical protein
MRSKNLTARPRFVIPPRRSASISKRREQHSELLRWCLQSGRAKFAIVNRAMPNRAALSKVCLTRPDVLSVERCSARVFANVDVSGAKLRPVRRIHALLKYLPEER